MSSAIEVLKELLKEIDNKWLGVDFGCSDDIMIQLKQRDALKEALLALEQKDNQVKWLTSCLKTRLDLCKEFREKYLDHYNKYIDIEIDFIYLSLERLGLNKSEIRKRVGEQK